MADRSGCRAERHGDEAAYRRGCRCHDAREARRIRMKRRREGRLAPGVVPSIGTARRLRALTALGWSPELLAARLGCTQGDILQLRRSRCNTVLRGTAARVAALYDGLEGTPGPSNRAKGWAVRFGWAPPLLWHGVNIDDPDARPVDDIAVPLRANRRVHLDDVDRFSEMWMSDESIAELLGVTVDAIRLARQRRGDERAVKVAA